MSLLSDSLKAVIIADTNPDYYDVALNLSYLVSRGSLQALFARLC